jgi:Predicted integral membrane protein
MPRIATGGLVALAMMVSPAKAALTACNATSYVLYAAGASLKIPLVESHGWTRIAPGACNGVVAGDLSADAYYLYARSSRAHSGPAKSWSGTVAVCAKDKDFTLKQPFSERCPADGFELSFQQIDTHAMRNWTATFRESPDLRALPNAKRAGLKRLLADSGMKTDDKGLDKTLSAFKARAHLAANAQDEVLFKALEGEALKSAAPTGYSVCNDTAAPFYAAIGQEKNGAYSSKGWWTVAPGTCAPLITDTIQGQKIWLRVERAKGPQLVGGPNGFCTTAIEFDIQGKTDCAKRGLTPSGFAETNAKGAPGFVAHVGAGGLR